jgi:hypothetical protein
MEWDLNDWDDYSIFNPFEREKLRVRSKKRRKKRKEFKRGKHK